MKKAIFFLCVFLCIQAGASLIFYLVALMAGVSPSAVPMQIGASVAASAVTIGVFVWKRWTPVFRRYMRSRPWAVLVWASVAACGAIIPSIGLQDVMPPLPNLVEAELNDLMANRWGYFAIGLAAPVAEEFVFRGAVLRSMLHGSGGHWRAIALSALLFALAHMNPAQMVHAFLIGLLLGWMYYRTGSIIPGIVYHWVNNSIAYVLGNLLPEADHLSDIFGNNVQHSIMAVLFSLCILLPALFQLHVNMREVKNND